MDRKRGLGNAVRDHSRRVDGLELKHVVAGGEVSKWNRISRRVCPGRPGPIVNSPRVIKRSGVGVRFEAIEPAEGDGNERVISAHDLRGGQPDDGSRLCFPRPIAQRLAVLQEPDVAVGLMADPRYGATQRRLREQHRRFALRRIKVEFFPNRKVKAISSRRQHIMRSFLALDDLPVLTIEGQHVGAAMFVFHEKITSVVSHAVDEL